MAKRAAARLADLYRQRDELAAQYPALAMRYAKDESDADTLNGHHREIARLDLQIRALTVAVPLFDGEARRIMQGNEVLARRPDDIAVELNNLRAEAAAEIARSRW